MELNTSSLMAVIAFTLIALVTDLKSRRIPNWLTVSTAVLGLVWHIVLGGFTGSLLSLSGFAIGFGFLLLLWLMGGGGGGDVKMMGAVGAWMGPLPTLAIFVTSSIYVIGCAMGLVLFRRIQASRAGTTPSLVSAGNDASSSPSAVTRESALRTTVPYALPVALSVWTLLAYQTTKGL